MKKYTFKYVGIYRNSLKAFIYAALKHFDADFNYSQNTYFTNSCVRLRLFLFVIVRYRSLSFVYRQTNKEEVLPLPY